MTFCRIRDAFPPRPQKKAEAEYDAFNKTQRIVSDFDREVQRLLDSEKRL